MDHLTFEGGRGGGGRIGLCKNFFSHWPVFFFYCKGFAGIFFSQIFHTPPPPQKKISNGLPWIKEYTHSYSSIYFLCLFVDCCRTAEVVEVHVYDGYENLASVSCLVDISIRWPSGPVPENVILPILEGNPVRLHVENGVARLPKLTLASRVGNYIGEYLLVFSSPSLENFEMKFSFSTGTDPLLLLLVCSQ